LAGDVLQTRSPRTEVATAEGGGEKREKGGERKKREKVNAGPTPLPVGA